MPKENKRRRATMFYPFKYGSKEALEKARSNMIGQPVWDDIRLKTKRIGVVVDATYTNDKELGKGICLTIEVFDEAITSNLKKFSLRGLSIGGNIKQ